MKQKNHVRIKDKDHPHYPKTGTLTGKVIRMLWGTLMAEMKFDDCYNEGDGCFVEAHQIAQL